MKSSRYGCHGQPGICHWALGDLVREIEPAVKPVLDQDEDVEEVLHQAACAAVW